MVLLEFWNVPFDDEFNLFYLCTWNHPNILLMMWVEGFLFWGAWDGLRNHALPLPLRGAFGIFIQLSDSLGQCRGLSLHRMSSSDCLLIELLRVKVWLRWCAVLLWEMTKEKVFLSKAYVVEEGMVSFHQSSSSSENVFILREFPQIGSILSIWGSQSQSQSQSTVCSASMSFMELAVKSLSVNVE